MAKQIIDIGTSPDDITGDPGRTAFTKVNENTTELYNDKADSADVLLLDGTQSMDANKSITFTSDGLDVGPSSTDGNGFPSIETTYCEVHYGYAGTGNDRLFFNYYKGSGVQFGLTANRQRVDWFLVAGYTKGVNFDFGSGVQMRYGYGTSNSKSYMRFGASGLDGVQFVDNLEAAFGTESDATIVYNGTDLLMDTAAVGSGTLDLVSQTTSAITTETVTDFVEIKIGGVLTKLAVVS